ncbi:histidine kinase sensor domain-containing protein [Colwellia echini]|uniref:histidine kinase n=1 Tax=Colwellia echini TaxID=1982103 RepID=A0ABY3MW70_9GAMM|nr:histidine kinase sensor domain-containing protein [Colwellia echini]TYK65396.1 HAMP domain-containing protein [Colwellia echini]
MTHRLFYKLCIIIASGIVALFYILNLLMSHTEDGMSHLSTDDRDTLIQWGKEAEAIYSTGDTLALEKYLQQLKQQEETWVAVARYNINQVAGEPLGSRFYDGYHFGRNVNWKIHLYFANNPTMEVPFENKQVSFLIQLPDRMRPGVYFKYTEVTMQIILPSIILMLLSYLLYRYITKPLGQLQLATREFSKGNFEVRASLLMGKRKDEFSELAMSFDQMAIRLSEQLINQRQLIADLSHELRTPLTRLDIALAEEETNQNPSKNIQRINRESKHIRKLVEDVLNLAWLENEKPSLQQESLELIDLLDVLIADAEFEFPDRIIECHLPNNALIQHSSHRAAAQALENILRNALRYTPAGQKVFIFIEETITHFILHIDDQGPGVPPEYLEMIFKPFFRVDKARKANSDSFGLGLALAQRQLFAIRSTVSAHNVSGGGLSMRISFPKT